MFITGAFTKGTKHCAEGWCRTDYQGYSESTMESIALDRLFYKYLSIGVAMINDGEDHRFQQKTIKERIMAALEEIKQKTKNEKV